MIKEGFNIRVEHGLKTLLVVAERGRDGLMAIAALPETEGRCVEQGFKDRIEQSSYDFLRDPVANRGNSERSEFRLAFWNPDAPERERLEGAIPEIPHQGEEIFVKVGGEHRDADLVDPRRAAIAPDGLKGLVHQRGCDSPCQGMVFLFGGHVDSHHD